MDDYTRRVRLRAYLIWERAGQPQGRDAEHWYQAEREVAQEEDAAGLRAGRAYDKSVKEFENPAESKERLKRRSRNLRARREMRLERAQETARRASKGDDAAGRR